jgi:hypothetical protein
VVRLFAGSKEGLPRGHPPTSHRLTWNDGNDLLEPIEDEKFQRLLDELMIVAVASVKPYMPAYHNGDHFKAVLANVQTLLPKGTPEAVAQAMQIAAAGHDVANPGSTFRSMAPRGVPMKELGLVIATEAVTAIIVDTLLKAWNFQRGMRLFIGNLTLASVFGIPQFGPRTKWERVLCCADVGPTPGTTCDNILSWLDEGVRVNLVEAHPARPASYRDWLERRLRFLGFLRTFTNPQHMNFVPGALAAGWDELWMSFTDQIQRAKDGTNPKLANAMREQLRAVVPADFNLEG